MPEFTAKVEVESALDAALLCWMIYHGLRMHHCLDSVVF